MFRYDPSRKRVSYFRKRHHHSVLVDENAGINTIRIGKYKGCIDFRWARCFHLSCRLQRRTNCYWCTSLSHVPSMLQKEYRPLSRASHSSIDNKLGCLMEDLQKAQSDSFYSDTSDSPSASTPASSPASIVTRSTYSPPTIVKAKEHLLKLTSKFRQSPSECSGDSVSKRVRPRLRRVRAPDTLKRPASSPPFKTKRVSSRPPTRGAAPVLAKEPLLSM